MLALMQINIYANVVTMLRLERVVMIFIYRLKNTQKIMLENLQK